MRPIAIDAETAAGRPGFERIVVGAPTGSLLGDGSSPEQAAPVDALRGIEDGWPLYVERWILEPGELEALKAGAQIELGLYVRQLPVHKLSVVRRGLGGVAL